MILISTRGITKVMNHDDKKLVKLNALLYQLGEQVKDLPTLLDYHEWKNNLDYTMQEIRDISDKAYESLEDLVTQVCRIGEEHIYELDNDEPPSVTARSSELYFEQVAYITSEVNRLKII